MNRNRPPMLPRLGSLAALVAFTSCTTPSARLEPDPIADGFASELAQNDVVFIGERHGNPVGHAFEAELLAALHERRGDVVLSMEMFERDVQGALDDYLAGRIDEAEFLERSRPWPHYAERYRPLIEYAKAHGLPVIAANLPTDLARKVSTEGVAAASGQEYAARETSAPKDAYWEEFQDSMAAHIGADSEDTMWRFYESQCLKDDTMAESITDFLARCTDGRPLVVHVCGHFHAARRLGTVARVAERMPELDLAVVGMQESAFVADGYALDYAVLVPPGPPDAEPGDADEDVDPGGRPALGFMPDYETDVDGVLVGALRPDGPAERAGLREGDIIVRVDEFDIRSLDDYLGTLSSLTIGSKVRVTVDRAGVDREFEVRVGSRID